MLRARPYKAWIASKWAAHRTDYLIKNGIDASLCVAKYQESRHASIPAWNRRHQFLHFLDVNAIQDGIKIIK